MNNEERLKRRLEAMDEKILEITLDYYSRANWWDKFVMIPLSFVAVGYLVYGCFNAESIAAEGSRWFQALITAALVVGSWELVRIPARLRKRASLIGRAYNKALSAGIFEASTILDPPKED